MIDLEIIGKVALGALDGLKNQSERPGLLPDFDNVALAAPIARNVDPAAVDRNVAMAHELPRSKWGWHKLRAIDEGIQAPLQKTDEVFGGVASEPRRLIIDEPELPLRDVGVVALQLLFRLQLRAEVRGLAAAALAVLAWPVFALVKRTFGTASEIFPKATVNFMLGADALCHVCAPKEEVGGAGPPLQVSLPTDGGSRHGHAKGRLKPPAASNNGSPPPMQAQLKPVEKHV